MEHVIGIGGVFLKARDPQALAAWYREQLGILIETGQTYGMLTSAAAGETTVWSNFPANTPYFGPGSATFMVNYRVRDLDAMLAQLRAGGAQVDDRIEEHSYGRFGWATDPEGNRFELWQPATPAEGSGLSRNSTSFPVIWCTSDSVIVAGRDGRPSGTAVAAQ